MIEAAHQTLTSAGFFVHQVAVKNLCQPPRHSQERAKSPTSALIPHFQSSTAPHVSSGQNSWCWQVTFLLASPCSGLSWAQGLLQHLCSWAGPGLPQAVHGCRDEHLTLCCLWSRAWLPSVSACLAGERNVKVALT